MAFDLDLSEELNAISSRIEIALPKLINRKFPDIKLFERKGVAPDCMSRYIQLAWNHQQSDYPALEKLDKNNPEMILERLCKSTQWLIIFQGDQDQSFVYIPDWNDLETLQWASRQSRTSMNAMLFHSESSQDQLPQDFNPSTFYLIMMENFRTRVSSLNSKLQTLGPSMQSNLCAREGKTARFHNSTAHSEKVLEEEMESPGECRFADHSPNTGGDNLEIITIVKN